MRVSHEELLATHRLLSEHCEPDESEEDDMATTHEPLIRWYHIATAVGVVLAFLVGGWALFAYTMITVARWAGVLGAGGS